MLGAALRFGVVGVLATAVHVGVLTVVLRTTELSPAWATIPAFLVALFFSYFLNHRWTFAAKRRHDHHLPRFATLAVTAAVLQFLLMRWITEVLALPVAVGVAAVVAVMPALTFLGNYFWAFRTPREN